jgi:hypothetical protein
VARRLEFQISESNCFLLFIDKILAITELGGGWRSGTRVGDAKVPITRNVASAEVAG